MNGCIASRLSFVLALTCFFRCAHPAEPVRVGSFAVDASPPMGSPLAYVPTREVTTPLSCRGIVILGAEDPIVLCALDWIGIANAAHLEFREHLAAAADTTPDRVAVHTLHQHDAPRCDFSTDALLLEYDRGDSAAVFDSAFAREVIRRAADATKKAAVDARPVTHLGLGEGRVERVASNRRILGPDGKVAHMRFSAAKDPAVRAFPEGTIDPVLKLISFWNQDEPLVALTYYATHPQSYYRTGQATPDFPGLARNARDTATGVRHVHFNGAAGNVAAGKYNDGSPENRHVLTDRVAAGMARAWNDTRRTPLTAADVNWETFAAALPPAEHIDEAQILARLKRSDVRAFEQARQARKVVWLRRCQQGDTIDIGCLHLGRARVLHMPGELFVEYQLAAQEMRPDLFVAMAAYGDSGPAYIGTAIAYEQGGYETSPDASLVAPAVEGVLMQAMRKLLHAEGRGPQQLGREAPPSDANINRTDDAPSADEGERDRSTDFQSVRAQDGPPVTRTD